MVVTVGASKCGNLPKNRHTIIKKISNIYMNGCICYQILFLGSLHLPKQGNLTWFGKRIIVLVRVHSMGCQDNGHMTSYQKW